MGNVDLLKKTRDHILLFPETHDQSTWHCETTMCIAGHASVLAGAKLARGVDFSGDPATFMYFEGDLINAASFAEEELGLTETEANYLFFCMDEDVAVKRVDQVIALWEEGKTLDDIEYDDRIFTEDADDRCDCGCEDVDYADVA